MKKTHFIFDLDDTLTNSYDVNQQLFVDTFLPHMPEIDQAYVRDVHFRSRGKSMHLQFEEIVNHFGLKLDPLALVKENEILHMNSVEKFNAVGMFDSTKEMLELIQNSGKLISVCTNRQYGSQKMIFEANNMTSYFANIISCADEGHEKPDPYCLLKLIEKYDEPKDSYIYFGDSKTDRDFANNAGIDFLIIDQYLNNRKFFKMILQSFF
jgi:HAD superfamily hydrolase (TIGR01549 family)